MNQKINSIYPTICVLIIFSLITILLFLVTPSFEDRIKLSYEIENEIEIRCSGLDLLSPFEFNYGKKNITEYKKFLKERGYVDYPFDYKKYFSKKDYTFDCISSRGEIHMILR